MFGLYGHLGATVRVLEATAEDSLGLSAPSSAKSWKRWVFVRYARSAWENALRLLNVRQCSGQINAGPFRRHQNVTNAILSFRMRYSRSRPNEIHIHRKHCYSNTYMSRLPESHSVGGIELFSEAS